MGWNASAAVNANRWIGVVADFGGGYGSPTKTEIFKPANCVLCTGTVSATLHNIHTFTAGPQVSIRHDNLTVFAHALFGGAHTREDLVSIVTPSANISSTSFAMIAGGGVDVSLGSHRFALRFQPDDLMTRILDRRQNNFRFSTASSFGLESNLYRPFPGLWNSRLLAACRVNPRRRDRTGFQKKVLEAEQ